MVSEKLTLESHPVSLEAQVTGNHLVVLHQ
jgi:hypothetical protein